MDNSRVTMPCPGGYLVEAGPRPRRRRAAGPSAPPGGLVAEVGVLPDPGVHRDRGGGRGVDRAGRAELRDREGRRRTPRAPRPRAPAPPGRRGSRPGAAASSSRGASSPGRLSMPSRRTGPSGRSRRYAARSATRLVVAHVLVAVGDHRAAPVPPTVADDVHLGGEERVGGADDRADVEVVLPVLDRDVEVVPAGVEVGDDRLHRPVAVAVDDVAAVALGRAARRRTARPVGHSPRPRPDARPRAARAASGRTAPARRPHRCLRGRPWRKSRGTLRSPG